MQYILTDSKGNPLSLRTSSVSVDMQDGTTLAEKEPVAFLVSIQHDLDAYPLVLLVQVNGDGSAVQLPCRTKYPGRYEVEIFTVKKDWDNPKIEKIRSREYKVTFGTHNPDSLYLRLL